MPNISVNKGNVGQKRDVIATPPEDSGDQSTQFVRPVVNHTVLHAFGTGTSDTRDAHFMFTQNTSDMCF